MRPSLQKKLLLTLALLVLLGGSSPAMAAAGGSSENPLVTLSYLKTTFTELILRQLDEKLEAAREKYSKAMEEKISAYRSEMTQLSAGGGSAAFRAVELKEGSKLTLHAGSELVLREGTLTLGAGEGLLDATGGQMREGGSLVKNHLYLAGETSCTMTATGGKVTILLRGTME